MASFLVESPFQRAPLERAAQELARRYLSTLASERGAAWEYFGVHDANAVLGDLESGTIIGLEVYQSHKKLAQAKGHVREEEQWYLRATDYPGRNGFYVATAVYWVGPPTKYRRRGALLPVMLVEAGSKALVIQKAESLALSESFRRRLAFYHKHKISVASLVLLGFRGIVPAEHGLLSGEPFQFLGKKLRRRSQLVRLGQGLDW